MDNVLCNLDRGQLVSTFRAEMRERIQDMSRGLEKVETIKTKGEQEKELDRLSGNVNSLSKAARLVGADNITWHCDFMGRVITAAKRGGATHAKELIPVLHETLDRLIRNARRESGHGFLGFQSEG